MSTKLSTVVKVALALAPVSFLASTNALASVAPIGGTPGNGELVFSITDTSTDASYSLDLGVTTSAILTDTASLPFTRNASSDTALQSFLTQGAGHNFVFSVVGGSFNNTTQLQSGKYVSTTGGVDPTTGTIPTNNQLKNWALMDTNFYGGLNLGDATPTSTNNSYFAAAGANGNFGNANGAETWFGNTASLFQTVQNLGTAQNFYAFTSTATGTLAADKARAVTESLLGSWTASLSGNVLSLSYTPNAVPIPAAVWLLGSGLLGLAGIGRRRAQAA